MFTTETTECLLFGAGILGTKKVTWSDSFFACPFFLFNLLLLILSLLFLLTHPTLFHSISSYHDLDDAMTNNQKLSSEGIIIYLFRRVSFSSAP